MLQLTQPAALMLDQVCRDQQIPDGYGVRVPGRSRARGDLALQITFAEAPAPHVTVDMQYGTKLFLAEEVVEPLSDVALDVTTNVAADGASPVRFVLRPQPPDHKREAGLVSMLGELTDPTSGPLPPDPVSAGEAPVPTPEPPSPMPPVPEPEPEPEPV